MRWHDGPPEPREPRYTRSTGRLEEWFEDRLQDYLGDCKLEGESPSSAGARAYLERGFDSVCEDLEELHSEETINDAAESALHGVFHA